MTLRLSNVIFTSVLLAVAHAFAVDKVSGANETFNIEPGARSAALGSATMAIDGDYLGLLSNPHQLANVNYGWVNFSHTEYYEDTRYDFASAVMPLGEGQGLGISFGRFGANDIPYIKEGEPLPDGDVYNTLSIADYVFSVSWGRRLTNRIDLGVSFHGIYRDMDQSGWGFRGDAGLRYKVIDRLYVSGLLKGWTSSATSWESGEFEYTSPEFYLAANYSVPVPYLYGTLAVYWQGAGLFHEESRALDFDTDEDVGARIWEDPLDWLSGGKAGVEFNFDFGLSLRAGLSSFTTFQSVTAGAGLTISKFLKIDYAFESHPTLSPVHRVSISVSPYLFSNKPKAGTPEAYVPQRTRLTEEPDEEEVVEEPAAEIQENNLPVLEKPLESEVGQGVSLEEPAETVNKPAIIESDDEVLE
ncbi:MULTISPECIES: hypothetical protein [unclassified Fibrobacter]|uniref:hypothetical protein n=1 Tax=unclassified Fibrobacter TaxID=2634177 RepID=UPI000D6C6689|nr:MULTISPECIES: hypothetical protein [unclassified Fibrobacter]PWJ61608.1 hypothetical protein BGX12_12630 [Fibrobacter sp. UWR4]PZW73994.1 hypothetical protein C8E88_100113 [Fibrobacter sp. UWR1]